MWERSNATSVPWLSWQIWMGMMVSVEALRCYKVLRRVVRGGGTYHIAWNRRVARHMSLYYHLRDEDFGGGFDIIHVDT